MTPNQIADHLVERGILYSADDLYSLDPPPAHAYCWATAKMIVTNWAVAGKCLEAMTEANISVNIDGIHAQRYVEVFNMTDKKFPVVDIDKSLPRAIIEAWYQATEQGESDERS